LEVQEFSQPEDIFHLQQRMHEFAINRIKRDLVEVLTTFPHGKFPGFDYSVLIPSATFLPSNKVETFIIKVKVKPKGQGFKFSSLLFYFQLTFNNQFPMCAPQIHSMTPIPHPCVNPDTLEICLYMLQPSSTERPYDGWSPAFSTYSIIMQLQCFFDLPELSITSDADMLPYKQSIADCDKRLSRMSVQELDFARLYCEFGLQDVNEIFGTSEKCEESERPSQLSLKNNPIQQRSANKQAVKSESKLDENGVTLQLDASATVDTRNLTPPETPKARAEQEVWVVVTSKKGHHPKAVSFQNSTKLASIGRPDGKHSSQLSAFQEKSALQPSLMVANSPSRLLNSFSALQNDFVKCTMCLRKLPSCNFSNGQLKKETSKCMECSQKTVPPQTSKGNLDFSKMTKCQKRNILRREKKKSEVPCNQLVELSTETERNIIPLLTLHKEKPVSFNEENSVAFPPSLQDGIPTGTHLSKSIVPFAKEDEMEWTHIPSKKKSVSENVTSFTSLKVKNPEQSEPQSFSNSFNFQLWETILLPLLPANSRAEGFFSTAPSKFPPVSFLSPTVSYSGPFAKFSETLIKDIALLVSPAEISRFITSCKAVYFISMKYGYLWRELVQRYFPSCPIISRVFSQDKVNFWYWIWTMKMNGIHYEELKCFYTKATINNDILGIPITFTTNPRTNKIDYIFSTMELVSYGATKNPNANKTMWGEKFKAWIPVFFCEEHFQKSLPILRSSLYKIAREDFLLSALEIFSKLMNTMVVLLVDNGISELDQALSGYGMIHRLFVCLVAKYPVLKKTISQRLRSFISNEKSRTKQLTPNLGELMALLSVSTDVGWMDIIVPLISESFARSVLWVCRDVPELAKIVSSQQNHGILEKIFGATATSRKIYSFHCCFLKLFSTAHGTNLQSVCKKYDFTLGILPFHFNKQLQILLDRAEKVSNWQSYFQSICLKAPTDEFLYRMWTKAVQVSLHCGYHTPQTDFSKIQSRGVSNILLRGTSYGKVVLCIDVSGSMDCTSRDPNTGKYLSRLEFVKNQLADIFSSKLTHRQQFTVMRFNHEVHTWSDGLVQATESNLKKAQKHVNSWEPCGGTAFAPVLQAAFGMKNVEAVYFLSDGEPDECKEYVVELIAKLSQNKKIHCHTTAFSSSRYGQELLKAMSEATGGSYYYFDFESDENY